MSSGSLACVVIGFVLIVLGISRGVLATRRRSKTPHTPMLRIAVEHEEAQPITPAKGGRNIAERLARPEYVAPAADARLRVDMETGFEAQRARIDDHELKLR